MNAIIYKIASPDGSKVYIGSSTQLYLSSRKAHHHGDYKKHNLGQAGRCKSYNLFDEFGFENCRWEVIEILNEATKEQKLLRERHWVESIGTLGQNRPVINEEEKKELKHESYQRLKAERPDVYKAQYKAKYEKNKEKLSEQHTCECGSHYTILHKNRHLLSRHHKLFTGELLPEEKKEKPEPTEEELAEKRRKGCESTKRCYAKDPEKYRQKAREYAEKIGSEETARRYKEWYDKVKDVEVVCEVCGDMYKKGNKSSHFRKHNKNL